MVPSRRILAARFCFRHPRGPPCEFLSPTLRSASLRFAALAVFSALVAPSARAGTSCLGSAATACDAGGKEVCASKTVGPHTWYDCDLTANSGTNAATLYSVEHAGTWETWGVDTGGNAFCCNIASGSYNDIEYHGGPGDDTMSLYYNNGTAYNMTYVAAFIDADAGDDTIFGSNSTTCLDKLWGGTGDDWIHGYAGDDGLDGKEGSDILYGGGGDDNLAGGGDADTLFGDLGKDYLDGGGGDDVMHGGEGDDEIWGDFHNPGDVEADEIKGDDDNDVIYGNAGADLICGGYGDDTLYGGADGDAVYGGPGYDVNEGNDGTDDCEAAGAAPYPSCDATTLTSCPW